MRRAVVDTNVLVSGFSSFDSQSSAPAEIVRQWQTGRYVLVTSEHVLGEMSDAFAKAYFRRTMPVDAPKRAIELLRRRAVIVPLSGTVAGVARHHHDDPVLETAVVGGADCIVTGDRELLALGRFRGVAIITPNEFLEVLDRETASESEH